MTSPASQVPDLAATLNEQVDQKASARWLDRPPLWCAVLTAGFLVAIIASFRLEVFGHRVLPVAYGMPLIIFVWLRYPLVLWFTVAAFTTINAVQFFALGDITGPTLRQLGLGYRTFAFSLVEMDMLIIAAVVHWLIRAKGGLEARNAELEHANREIAVREEELARTNEELQAQAEELARQGEELRITNEELARQQRTLEVLLALSRSLTPERSPDEAVEQVCRTLEELIEGTGGRTGLLEFRDGKMVVRCHQGFGPQGIESDVLEPHRSFAEIIFRRGRAGYIEDLGDRPDLQVPQPRVGPRVRSILAVPLRTAGKTVGTLEAYRASPGPWSDEQIALMESLATQTSVSLETTQLFESISRERLKFETVFRTVPFGIAVCNVSCEDIRLNPSAAAMLNVAVDANLADPAVHSGLRFYRDGRQVGLQDWILVRAAARGESTFGHEAEVVLQGGKRLVLLESAAPIRDSAGTVTGAVCAFMDIAPQKELQRELDRRRLDAEEASGRKTRFLAAVSHDIRTPTNAISLLAELIRRTASNPAMYSEIPDLARELHMSAKSLVELLGDVMDLARFDSGTIDISVSTFSLNELLIDEQRRMLPLARERGLDLNVQLVNPPIWLRTDRIKMARVIANLAGNAIKFTEKGFVEFGGTSTNSGGATIWVRDTGIGIASEHLTHVFDEFVQLLNPERDRNKGIGLGLTICKRLVDAMGCGLDVQSELGKGSRFAILFPPGLVVPEPPR